MDGPHNQLDNPNIRTDLRTTMIRVPTYALYGEHDQPLIPESLHVESIAQRSRLYDWEIRPHRHDLFVQLLCLRSGEGDAVFEEARQAFDAPCLILVPALVVHGFRFSHDIDGVILTVARQQVEALLAPVPDLAERLNQPHCLQFAPGSGEFEAIAQAVSALTRESQGAGAWRMATIEALLMLALVGVGRAAVAQQGHHDGPSARSLQHAQRFRVLLDRHFRTERGVSFYAAELGITPTQLNRVCRDVLDNSVLGVIQSRLVLEAKRDLAYTLLSVKEIALTLGFADAAYFTRFFAKETGMSPSQFREEARRALADSGARRRAA